jgi:hypothetical protein
LEGAPLAPTKVAHRLEYTKRSQDAKLAIANQQSNAKSTAHEKSSPLILHQGALQLGSAVGSCQQNPPPGQKATYGFRSF